jgi:hypothetical protein
MFLIGPIIKDETIIEDYMNAMTVTMFDYFAEDIAVAKSSMHLSGFARPIAVTYMGICIHHGTLYTGPAK